MVYENNRRQNEGVLIVICLFFSCIAFNFSEDFGKRLKTLFLDLYCFFLNLSKCLKALFLDFSKRFKSLSLSLLYPKSIFDTSLRIFDISLRIFEFSFLTSTINQIIVIIPTTMVKTVSQLPILYINQDLFKSNSFCFISSFISHCQSQCLEGLCIYAHSCADL